MKYKKNRGDKSSKIFKLGLKKIEIIQKHCFFILFDKTVNNSDKTLNKTLVEIIKI